jgi:hypothetical protein
MSKKGFSKDQKIRGLRKALKNPKTPKQFLPSMKKRLARLLAVVLFALCLPAASHAQFIGYTSPQTVQASLASSVACTGSTQTFTTGSITNFNNLGQTQHTITAAASVGTQTAQVTIFGVDAAGNTVQISDTAFIAAGGGTAVLQATGYYPQIQVQVLCSGNSASFSLAYSGASSTSIIVNSSQLATMIDKPIASGLSAGTTVTETLATPYGSSAGVILFAYTGGAGPSGSTLTITCQNILHLTTLQPINVSPISLPTPTGSQFFPIPPVSCPGISLTYTAGGASSNAFSISYFFQPPGFVNTDAGNYAHVASTTATAIKAAGGTLVSLTINTPAAGTVSIFDLPSASCTGTPATNTIAVITATSSAPLATFRYNVETYQGICVKASSASIDFTVSYQ